MSGDVRIQVDGVDRLTASLDQLSDDLAQLAPPDAAKLIGATARQRAPKRTGRLASSFSSDTGNGVVSVRFGAAHAGPLNFGVGPRPGLRGPHNIAATRFLTGTISDRERAWMETYEKSAERAISKVKGA